jgi:hypothetical protein
MISAAAAFNSAATFGRRDSHANTWWQHNSSSSDNLNEMNARGKYLEIKRKEVVF